MSCYQEAKDQKIEIDVSHFDIIAKYRDSLCATLVEEPPRHPGGQKRNHDTQKILLEIMQCNQWLKTNFKLFI